MGTIVTRQKNNGAPSYMAKIVLKRNCQIIHRESKTFTTHIRQTGDKWKGWRSGPPKQARGYSAIAASK